MWNAVARPFSLRVRHDVFEQQPPSPGDSNSLRPLVCPKLGEYRLDMRLDCSNRDCQVAADLLVTEPQHEVTQNRELTIRKRLMGQTLGDSRSHNWRKRRGAPMQREHPLNQILSATSLQQISPDTVLDRATNSGFIIELRDDENRTAQSRVVRVSHTGVIIRH